MSENCLSVSSELYDEYSLQKNSMNVDSCTKLNVKFLDTSFLKNGCMIVVDEDGDLLVARKSQLSLVIEVSLSTKISGVGLQLWRGALLLSDLLIHFKEDFLMGKTILELGSGVGLTSIVASMFAKRVITTDINQDGILERIKSNFNLNNKIVRSEFEVLPLDFFSTEWDEKLFKDITNAHIVIAADVIYDNSLTDAFVQALTKVLMTSKKTAFIALEKRFVFTIDDLDTVAPCYDHFLQRIKSEWNKPPQSQWKMEQVVLNFPQYLDYEKSKHLVLWRIDS